MNEISLSLGRIINALPEMVQQRLDDAGYIVEEKAKENCPAKTGTLRRSISHEADTEKCIIGTDVEYAVAVHEGHGSYPGKPFLQDALNESISEIKECFAGMLEDDG